MNENKMRPKRTVKHSGPNWKGKSGNTADKTTLNQAKRASLLSSAALVLPFAGKVFYLDLPSNRTAETLESDIKALGGTVEKFFSKDIKYLVSNKQEAKYVHCLRQDSPVPSPDSGPSSPHPRSNPPYPGSHGDNIKSRSQGQTDTYVTSRGKSLVERVVKKQERVQLNKILSNALEWGVKILYIEDVMAYVQKKKRIINSQVPVSAVAKTTVKSVSAAKQGGQKVKGGRISKPFIKVEDSSRHYRPIYLTMTNMPEFNLKAVAPCTPFGLEDKDPPGNKQRGHRGEKAMASEERALGRKKNRDKKRAGYCECCMVKYENLTAHLQSERHTAFSKSEEYLVVDRLISTLPCNFIHIKAKAKRPKCSVSSVVIVPGPCVRTDQRHKVDPDPSDTVKEEKPWPVDGCEDSHSGHSLKIKSSPDAPLRIRKDCERRNCYTYSDRSKHKSLARKRLCRQNSLTPCTQKAQAQIQQFELERAPSRGDGVPSFPSSGPRVDPEDQIPHRDISTAHFCSLNMQNEVASKSVTFIPNKQEESVMNRDALLSETLQDRDISPDKVTGKGLSVKEEGSRPTQTLSPGHKIQRKVRVYKRKRRKMETNVECKKPSDTPENVLLKLWELFQSSEDMDMDFHGFENVKETN
ncbi:protein DBF4 homolog A [Mugil cephalus]|uniref:protein DBF4 homolog A n=1 Tax=Mugil cephalus TaxID=48193 RepID=UPI001FB790C5|nr:protein DBF4 homolog A [Mugil cephalus]